jgi:hypothetical protein
MTTIELRGQQQEVSERLPNTCMCCGAMATREVNKQFTWFPRWAYLGLFFGGLPFCVLAMALQKRMRVRLPVCDQHRWPWLGQYLFATLMILWLLIVPWLAIAGAAMTEKSLGRGNPVALILLIGWLVVLLLFVPAAIVVRRRFIHPRSITDDAIVLGGVHRDFAEQIR